MRRTSFWQITLLTIALVWAITGCDNNASSPSVEDELLTREQVVDLDDPYGGFNFGDETPNFADPMLAADYGPEAVAEFDDPMENDVEVNDIRSHARPHRYLMITWGNLDADTTIDFVTDWTGGLGVKNGVVVLKRTIRFDAHDEILPRTSRDRIDWISQTKPHFDGVLVELHKVVARDTTGDSTLVALETDRPLSVTFRTGPLTVTIDEEDLKDLHRVVTVDDAGNAVAFNTVTVSPGECPNGFLAGQWRNVNDRPGGIFRGHWISHNGVHMGYLRGVYGPNSRGEKVFFGKWIDRSGRFQGLLAGHYQGSDDRPGGSFEGIWLSRELREMGRLGGEYGVRENDEGRPVGFFRGRWHARCR
jgi:hypothetical protein